MAKAKTGEKGHYRCKTKEDGMVIVRFECPGCLPHDEKVRLFKDKGVRLNVVLQKDENYVAPVEEKEKKKKKDDKEEKE